MSGQAPSSRFRRVRDTVQTKAVEDVGTPLWFIVLMAIFTVVITISILAVFLTNSKIKKGAGYKGGAHAETTPVV